MTDNMYQAIYVIGILASLALGAVAAVYVYIQLWRKGYRSPFVKMFTFLLPITIFSLAWSIYIFLETHKQTHLAESVVYNIMDVVYIFGLVVLLCLVLFTSVHILPRKKRIAGTRKTFFPWKIAGIALIPLACVWSIVFAFQGKLSLQHFAVFIAGIIFCFYMARRFKAPTMTDVRADDSRPPVIYLRAFNMEDDIFVELTKKELRSYTSYVGYKIGATFEEYLSAEITNTIGPFVALGSPEDYAPPEGAARAYADDMSWMQEFQKLACEAACIITGVNKSDNLKWELETLKGNSLHEKLFVITRPHRTEGREYKQIRFDLNVLWHRKLGQLGRKLKGIQPVSWVEFANSLRQWGYYLDLVDPGPGAVIAIDAQGNGVLIATNAFAPADFVAAIQRRMVERGVYTLRGADPEVFESSDAGKHPVHGVVDRRPLISHGELGKALFQRALVIAAPFVFFAVGLGAVVFWFFQQTQELDRALEGLARVQSERTEVPTPTDQTIAQIGSRGGLARLSAKVENVYASQDGTMFVIVHAEGKSELHGIADGSGSIELTDKVAGWLGFFSPVFFVNGGKLVIVNYVRAAPELRRTDTGALLTTLPSPVIEPLSSSKNVFGLVYAEKAEAEVLRADSGAVIARLPSLGKQEIFLALSSDGRFVVHNRSDGPAQLRRTEGGKVVATLAGDVNILEFTADEKTIVLGYTNAPPEVRRTDTGAVIATLPAELGIRDFSPNKAVFVVNRTGAPSELRRTSDGVLISQLAGQVEKYHGATFSPDGSAFVVNYTDAQAELRRTSDGVLISQLAGQVEKSDGVNFSPDGSAFVVDYADRTDLRTELRRTADGTVLYEIASGRNDLGRNYPIFSPDGTSFVVRHRKGLFSVSPRGQFELHRTEDGTLVARFGRDASDNIVSSLFNLNFALNYSSNGKHGVAFSPDGSTLLVRYDSGRGELWDIRGTPRRLTDLGLGLVKAGFVFTSGVEQLAVQYNNGQLYLLDIARLRTMGSALDGVVRLVRGGHDKNTVLEIMKRHLYADTAQAAP